MPHMQLPDVTLGAVMRAPEEAWMAAGLALGLAAVGYMAFLRLRGATLAAPAAWAIVSSFTIAAVEAALAIKGEGASPFTASLWRYAAAVSTTCPLMAVLGAKRPQDRGWQWIVLSLWVVLLVPAGQAIAGRSAQQLELFTAWRLLLVVLVAMSVLNYLPTRHAGAAMLFAVGQTLTLWPYLSGHAEHSTLRVLGLATIMVAALVILAQRRRPHVESPASPLEAENRRWQSFRDGWGAFWGLRVMHRLNQTAELGCWPVRLEWWNGFVPTSDCVSSGGQPSTANCRTDEQVDQALDSLLRRFERLT